jgi:hypothetical protein
VVLVAFGVGVFVADGLGVGVTVTNVVLVTVGAGDAVAVTVTLAVGPGITSVTVGPGCTMTSGAIDGVERGVLRTRDTEGAGMLGLAAFSPEDASETTGFDVGKPLTSVNAEALPGPEWPCDTATPASPAPPLTISAAPIAIDLFMRGCTTP